VLGVGGVASIDGRRRGVDCDPRGSVKHCPSGGQQGSRPPGWHFGWAGAIGNGLGHPRLIPPDVPQAWIARLSNAVLG